METQLVSVRDLGYMRHNRGYANRYRHARRNQRVDTLARDFQKHLRLVERELVGWFSRLTNAKSERILRYKSSQGILKYQEIDFIAESELGLKFCELKLKKKFSASLSDKESGLNQLRTTTKVASSKYNLNGSLAICIDMSFLYEGKSSECENFVLVEELGDYFKRNGGDELIWVNIKDILPIALMEGWLTQESVDELRDTYKTMNNPMSILPEANTIPLNTPFANLRL